MTCRTGYLKAGFAVFLLSLGSAQAESPPQSCKPLLVQATDVLVGASATQLRQVASSLLYVVEQISGDATLAATPLYQARLRRLSSLGHGIAQRLVLDLGGALVDTEDHGPSAPHRQLFQNIAYQLAAAMTLAVDYSAQMGTLSRPHRLLDLLGATETLRNKLRLVLPEGGLANAIDEEARERYSYLRNAVTLDNELGYAGSLVNRGGESMLARIEQLEQRRQRLLNAVRSRLRRITTAMRDPRSMAIHSDVESSLVAAEENIALLRRMLQELLEEPNPRHRAGLKLAIEAISKKSIFAQHSAMELADIAAANYIRGYRSQLNSDHSVLFVPEAGPLASHLSPSPLLQGILAADAN